MSERQPVMVHCGDCKHEWAAFYLPLVCDEKGMKLLDTVGRACPMCASDKTFMGRAPDAKINDAFERATHP